MARPQRFEAIAMRLRFAVTATLMAAAVAGFVGLGNWQLERRAWKLDLIARVDDRIHREPVAAPGPEHWSGINAADHGYRRVRLHGRWLTGHDTFVQATTALGSGYWLLTPLEATDGTRTLVNRGFVRRRPPPGDNGASPDGGARTGSGIAPGAEAGPVTVTGLLRISEPDVGFPRRNEPASDRWFSRDVAAIAARRGLPGIAPYFVDAEAPPGTGGHGRARDPLAPGVGAAPEVGEVTLRPERDGGEPVAGLTVVAFRNNHLVYALTWYGLAAMTAVASAWALIQERKARASASGPPHHAAGR
jgi:surfeit locus 1 family protein